MYNALSKCIEKPTLLYNFLITIRKISATEISTALRPFYFAVHPDLFGKYPDQRVINENSLKQLSSFIETTQSHKPFQPCVLKFYLRDSNFKKDGKFRFVEIQLKERNIHSAILTILKTCDLSTDYINTITPKKNQGTRINAQNFGPKMYSEEYDIDDIIRVKRKVDLAKESVTLRNWLDNNFKVALEKYNANSALRKDIESMCADICNNLGVKEVRWDCGWNVMHFRGCLQSFKALAEDHPTKMHVLKDRIIVFAPFTGISLDGHIMLNSGEVRNNWLDLIRNVRKRDNALLRIPSFEKAVSQVLRDIRVVRRKFMPKILAEEYEKHLRRLMTNLGDYRSTRNYPENWPESLKNFEIVVETEAGPLMVSPTGQFIVPSSCPGFLLVNFITENMEKAAKKIMDYNIHKHIEKFLHALCLKELELAALEKDDNVTPDIMIKCCEQLLENKEKLHYMKGLHLNITTYYSVLSDGIVCIPWNFKI